jgi:hypothetical protein
MNFKSHNFELEVDHINYYLGLPNDIDVDAYRSNNPTTSFVDWNVHIEERSWGIKAISAYVTKVNINIKWEILKEDLNELQIVHLFERHNAYIDYTYVNGIISINGDGFEIHDTLEFLDVLKVNEVTIDFMDEEIIIS